jgi:cell division protein FtsI/penicillin-binding protein 2
VGADTKKTARRKSKKMQLTVGKKVQDKYGNLFEIYSIHLWHLNGFVVLLDIDNDEVMYELRKFLKTFKELDS